MGGGGGGGGGDIISALRGYHECIGGDIMICVGDIFSALGQGFSTLGGYTIVVEHLQCTIDIPLMHCTQVIQGEDFTCKGRVVSSQYKLEYNSKNLLIFSKVVMNF